MYMRLLELKINKQYLDMFRGFYERVIIPELQNVEGCLFASLMQSNPNPTQQVSLTIWDRQEYAEAYQMSGVFQDLLGKAKPFWAESTEWKINLSESMELEFGPRAEEPVLSEFAVTAQKEDKALSPAENPQMHVRLFSAKIEEGKESECRRIYYQEILPHLQNLPGCLSAYLLESIRDKNEAISVTIWDSKENADKYENSGQFKENVRKVEHTFSRMYQWKLALEKNIAGQVKTTEDVKLKQFRMITGKRFK